MDGKVELCFQRPGSQLNILLFRLKVWLIQPAQATRSHWAFLWSTLNQIRFGRQFLEANNWHYLSSIKRADFCFRDGTIVSNTMERPRPQLILDVDQTLAGGVVAAHLRVYNQALDLGMTPVDILTADRTYPKTFDVRQIDDFRKYATDGERRFQEVRQTIRTSDEVHMDLTPLPGSKEGANRLLAGNNIVFGGYYTVRPPEIEGTTKKWLGKHGFPSPNRVITCENHLDKLTRILNDHVLNRSQNTSKVVLIDDSEKGLIDAAEQLVHSDQTMVEPMRHLVVVGFGLPHDVQLEGTIRPGIGLHVMRLPSWQLNEVNELRARLGRLAN